VIDYFIPDDAKMLDGCDLDLGAGAPLLIPGTDRIVGGGKTGKLYALSRYSMRVNPQVLDGGIDAYGTGIVCNWEGGPHLHGTPAYWKGANASYVFIWAEQDYLRRFNVKPDGTLDSPPLVGGIAGPACDTKDQPPGLMCPMPGGMLSVSANGNTSGIVWATVPANNGHPYWTEPGRPPPGTLVAYNADRMMLLWRQDLPSLLGKWTPPTVADGKVFVATSPLAIDPQNGRFLVYELGPWPAVQPPIEAALLIDSQNRLDVSWLDYGDGYGWHPPLPISDPVTRPGAPIAMVRQTNKVLASVFVDGNGKLDVASLNVEDGQGWHKPVAISDTIAWPGSHLAMAKQSDTVVVALFVDVLGKLNVSWFDQQDHLPWHKPIAFSDSFARPGTPIETVKQTDTFLEALMFDQDGRLNRAWLNLNDHQGWHKPQVISESVASVAAHLAIVRESNIVTSALFFDRNGRLNRAWFDVPNGQWHPPEVISDVVAPPGAAIAMARQDDNISTALFVGNDQKLNLTWIDVRDPQGWHKPQAISDVVAPPGAVVAMGMQSDVVLTALFVDQNGRLEVAWLDYTDGKPWHSPVVISDPVAPPGADLAMERQAP
jgi:hypothetical protein